MDTSHITPVNYGPWALITGASDGTGEQFAIQLAEKGFNLVLIARRLEPLKALSAQLERDFSIKTRTFSLDLYDPVVPSMIKSSTDDIEIGLYIANAGSDPHGSHFLDKNFDAWEAMLNRNILAVARNTYDFAAKMKERRKGGIIILSSGAALAGQPHGAVYTATKAFQLNFSESLWSELQPYNVDVLCCICGAMNTPTLTTMLKQKGLAPPPMLEPEGEVRAFLAGLGKKPVHMARYGEDESQALALEAQRLERLRFMEEMSKVFHG